MSMLIIIQEAHTNLVSDNHHDLPIFPDDISLKNAPLYVHLSYYC